MQTEYETAARRNPVTLATLAASGSSPNRREETTRPTTAKTGTRIPVPDEMIIACALN